MLSAALVAKPQFRPPSTGDTPSSPLSCTPCSTPSRLSRSLASSLVHTRAKPPLRIFNRLQTSPLFMPKEWVFLFNRLPTLFSRQKIYALYFHHLANSFAQNGGFSERMQTHGHQTKLPYPRPRCGYRTQTGRQCRSHVLDPINHKQGQAGPGNTILDAGVDFGRVMIMSTARKITVQVPEELLEKAQQASGAGITQTVRTGLQFVAASRTYARLRGLRGKVKFSRTARAQRMTDDRRRHEYVDGIS